MTEDYTFYKRILVSADFLDSFVLHFTIIYVAEAQRQLLSQSTTFPCNSLKTSDAHLKHMMTSDLLKDDCAFSKLFRKLLNINYSKNSTPNMLIMSY